MKSVLQSMQWAVLDKMTRLPEDQRYPMKIAQLLGKNNGAAATCLARLEAQGLVTSTMSEPTPIRGGRSRRLYAITGEGRKAMHKARVLYRITA